MSDTNFEQLVGELERLESITSSWPASQQQTLQAIRTTIEQIQAGAFRHLLRIVKEQPGGLDALSEAIQEPWVANVLMYHELLRPPAPSLHDLVEVALEKVRPQLASHNGDVELVSVEPPEVKIRLLGTCDGCALSTLTVKLGIEKAIKEAVESIEVVTIVKEGPARATSSPDKSPFEQHWEALCDVSELPEEGIHVAESEKASVLLTLVKGEIKAYPNACTHLGMPLDTGSVKDGILTCAYHGFQYLLSSGECLTAPEIQLPRYPTKIEEGKVWVQLTD